MQFDESSLSRVWTHFNDPKRSAAILTAFRGEYTYEENVARNRSLAADLRNHGYGFIYVNGFWIENQGTEHERKVKEDSIFAIGSSSDKQFDSNIHKLGNKYDQEAVLVKDNDGAQLIFKDGSTQPIGKLSPGGLGDIYTQLRNKKTANSFTFVSEQDDSGFIARLAKLAGVKH